MINIEDIQFSKLENKISFYKSEVLEFSGNGLTINDFIHERNGRADTIHVNFEEAFRVEWMRRWINGRIGKDLYDKLVFSYSFYMIPFRQMRGLLHEAVKLVVEDDGLVMFIDPYMEDPRTNSIYLNSGKTLSQVLSQAQDVVSAFPYFRFVDDCKFPSHRITIYQYVRQVRLPRL